MTDLRRFDQLTRELNAAVDHAETVMRHVRMTIYDRQSAESVAHNHTVLDETPRSRYYVAVQQSRHGWAVEVLNQHGDHIRWL